MSAAVVKQPLLPGATLGVMGGGQLGRMFVHAAQQAGYFTAVLDPDADSPAGRVSHHHVHADYLDSDGLARLSRLADAITTEFENVPARALASLAGDVPVAPGAEAVAIAQDRIREKAQDLYVFSLGGERAVGDWKMDAHAAESHGGHERKE